MERSSTAQSNMNKELKQKLKEKDSIILKLILIQILCVNSHLILTNVPLTFLIFMGRADPVPKKTTSGYLSPCPAVENTFIPPSINTSLNTTLTGAEGASSLTWKALFCCCFWRLAHHTAPRRRPSRSSCTRPPLPESLGPQTPPSQTPRRWRRGWHL